MLTPVLQEIAEKIKESLTDRYQTRQLPGEQHPHAVLLATLRQIDELDTQLSRAYREGGLAAASRVIIRPGQSSCQICGRTLIPKHPKS